MSEEVQSDPTYQGLTEADESLLVVGGTLSRRETEHLLLKSSSWLFWGIS